MRILRELWTGDIANEEVKSTYQYVLDLRDKLESTCKMAHDELMRSRRRYAKYYNRKARNRKFLVGDQVLLLLPTSSNKLLVQWKGPYEIKEVKGDMDYKIDIDGNVKTFHANMLKLYVKRQSDKVEKGVLNVVCAAVIEDDVTDSDIEVSLECPLEVVGEGIDKVDVSAELTKDQRQQINALLAKHSSVFTDKPGCTNLLDLKIKLNTSDPIRIKGYPVPYNAREAVDEEVSKMLDLGVIEPSNSPYSSPVVLVRKKDGTNRFCIDFRQLNKITVFDAEPMPDMEGLFAKLSGNRWISKLDLSKGYWQVPIVPESRALTAFATQKGLYQFKVMPFGLVGASATCCRLMRKLLKGLTNVDSFVDDIFVFTNTWSEHMYLLGELFNRLRRANLTVRPTKCSIGYTDLDCLGHRVSGMGQLKPHP